MDIRLIPRYVGLHALHERRAVKKRVGHPVGDPANLTGARVYYVERLRLRSRSGSLGNARASCERIPKYKLNKDRAQVPQSASPQ